ncbi:HNH endonuclease signature motif containing protein [Prauserella halophila]|uniref:HNH endonuclease signature motif containing protein n=1 Tax=Prauserella halophila TaxID=185641 RepID=A0ABN1VWQ2_9PSEU|nr:HNH endonuclease signature motif containing protein [Prauserella halophila]MCP2234625.1 protein of unknown function (DUF222) [Prauserella halophila]
MSRAECARAERARALRVRRAQVDAEEVAFLAEAAAVEDDWWSLAEELTPELRASPVAVRERIRRSVELARRMPRILEAMRAGELESYAVQRVLKVTAALDDEAARAVDRLLAGKLDGAGATLWQPRNLTRCAARLVEKVDPGGQAGRARRARAERRVELVPGENAVSVVSAELPAEVAAACYARIEAMARSLRRGGEQRTWDQLRADVTADLLLGNDPGAAPPAAPTMVHLHLPVDTALSISEQGCELDGYGPVPAVIAREIMTGPASVWRAVLCDPGTGEPVDLGRSRRRPSETIRQLVRVRDRECVVPWCHRPARHCDHDHEREWVKDRGATSVANAGPRCRRHHRLKNDPRWATRYDPVHGTTTVTTPNGATYTGRREPVLAPREAGTDGAERPETGGCLPRVGPDRRAGSDQRTGR